MTATQAQEHKARPQTFQGVVVSTKMRDTVVVEVERFVQHPKYRKYLRHSARLKAHDAGNTKKAGEKVTIIACRPLSKDKKFRVLTERSEV